MRIVVGVARIDVGLEGVIPIAQQDAHNGLKVTRGGQTQDAVPGEIPQVYLEGLA